MVVNMPYMKYLTTEKRGGYSKVFTIWGSHVQLLFTTYLQFAVDLGQYTYWARFHNGEIERKVMTMRTKTFTILRSMNINYQNDPKYSTVTTKDRDDLNHNQMSQSKSIQINHHHDGVPGGPSKVPGASQGGPRGVTGVPLFPGAHCPREALLSGARQRPRCRRCESRTGARTPGSFLSNGEWQWY